MTFMAVGNLALLVTLEVALCGIDKKTQGHDGFVQLWRVTI